MKTSRIVMAFMVAATMFSCQKIEKDDNVNNSQRPLPEGDYSVFTIGAPEIGPATKMTLGPVEGSDAEMVLWEVGDEVWIMREGGDAGMFWANSIKDGGKSADFYGLQFSTGGKYRAVYPSSAVTYWENGPAKRYDSFKAVLPSVQKYVPNSFPKEANLSMAEWDEDKGEKRLMKNLAGAIRFNLTGNITVGRLELYSSTSLLNGYYDMAKEAFFEMPTVYNEQYDCELGQYRTVLDCSYDIEREDGLIERMSVKLNENEPTQFNFVVAPGALSHGFELSIYDAEGELINVLSTSKDNTVERSSIVVMPTINVVTEEKAGDPTLISDVNSVVATMLDNMGLNAWTAVRHVEFESVSNKDSGEVISQDGYVTKAYVDFDASSGTLYYRTSGEKMYLSSGREFFYGFASLEDITGLDKLDGSQTVEFSSMFKNCSKLKSIDLSSLNAAIVYSANEMFWGCSSLEKVNLSGFGTEFIYDATGLFRYCYSLGSVDLSGFSFDDHQYVNVGEMFFECVKLGSIKLPSDFMGTNAEYTYMFTNAGTGTEDRTLFIDCSYAFQALFQECENRRYEGRESSIGSYGPKGSETVDNNEHVVNYVFKDRATAVYTTATFNETAKSLANASVVTKSGSGISKESVDTRIKRVRFAVPSSITSPYTSVVNFMDWNEESGTITVHFTDTRITKVWLSGSDAEGMFQNMSALESIEGIDKFGFYYDLSSMANMFKGCSNLRELNLEKFVSDSNPDYEGYDLTGFLDGAGSAVGRTRVTCSRQLMKAIVAADPESASSVIWDVPEAVLYVGLDREITKDFGEALKGLANGIEHKQPVLSSMNLKPSGSNVSYDDNGSIIDGLIRHIVFTRGTSNPAGYDYDAFANWDEETATITVYSTSGAEDAFYIRYAGARDAFCNFTALEDIKGLDMIASYYVESMGGMFRGCSSLKTLDMSSFDKEYLMDTSHMFEDCRSLTSLDFSGYEIKEQSYAYHMITNAGIDAPALTIKCSPSLMESLDGTPFNGWSANVNYIWDVDAQTGEVADTINLDDVFVSGTSMFNTVIKNAVNGRTDMKVTSSDYAVKSFDFVIDKNSVSPLGPTNIFYADFDDETGKVTVHLVVPDSIPEEIYDQIRIPVSQSSFFRGFTAIEKLDLSFFEIADLSYIVAGCRNLKEITFPVGGVHAYNNDKYENALEGTSASSGYLKIRCDAATKDILKSSGYFSFIPVWDLGLGDNLMEFSDGTSINSSIKDVAGLNPSYVSMFNQFFLMNDSIKKIDFQTGCSDLSGNETQEIVSYDWNKNTGTFTFRTSQDKFVAPMDMTMFFMGLTGLKSITGLENVDFSASLYWWNAFLFDESLTALDLSEVIGTVSDMDSAFYGCSSLQWLDLSGIDTSDCEYLCNTLAGCVNLGYIRLGEGFAIPETGCDYDYMLDGTAVSTADQTLNIACPDSVWEQLASMASDLGLDSSVTLNHISDADFLAAKSSVRTLSVAKKSTAPRQFKAKKKL